MTDTLIADPQAQAAPGRSCPLHYRSTPTSFACAAQAECETLYIVGRLYGKESAFGSVLELFDRETGNKRLVFNGDFNWLNAAPASFESINRRVLGFDALRGNVETELGSANDMAGLLTHISVRGFRGDQRRYGDVRGSVHLGAIAIEIDSSTWQQSFLRQWSPGSDAHRSYCQRITHGPACEPADTFITSEP